MSKGKEVKAEKAYVLRSQALRHNTDAVSVATGLRCRQNKTRQEFKEEVNINTIVRRFGIDGQLPVGVRMPTYGDFTGVSDYQSAANAMRQAEEAFMELPAHIRARFSNNPQMFVDFCSDEANVAEARSLGLVPPGEVPDVPGTPVPDSPPAAD